MRSEWRNKIRLLVVGTGLAVIIPLALAASASAFTITFGGATGYSAVLDVTRVGGDLRVVVTNNTTGGATVGGIGANCGATGVVISSSTDAACRLLVSFGWASNALGTADIVLAGTTATIGPDSGDFGRGDVASAGCSLSPIPGPVDYLCPSGTDWSGEWARVNDASPDSIGTFDFLSTSRGAGADMLSGANRDGSTSVDGPQGGILSNFFSNAGGNGFVQNSLVFLINFDEDLDDGDLAALQSATWFVEFGSSGYFFVNGTRNGREFPAPEPNTLVLLASGLAGVVGVANRQFLRHRLQ